VNTKLAQGWTTTGQFKFNKQLTVSNMQHINNAELPTIIK